MKRTLLIAIALGIVATCHARETRIPLRYTDGEGVRRDLAFASLIEQMPAPDADGLIAIEAEAALRHQFNPDVRRRDAGMPEDPDAVGGEYLPDSVYASYEFIADQPGDYWLWARVRTGEGHWRFRDVVNRTVWWFFDEGGRDEAPENPDEWHWVFRRKVSLREGVNTMQITDYGYEFPLIDRFVFAPSEDWTPEGAGPEVVMRENAEGWVETVPIDIPGLQSVVAIGGLPHESKQVQWRFGEGEWQALGVPTDQNGWPVRSMDLDIPDAEGALQFRIALEALENAPVDILSFPPNVTVEVDDRLVELLSGNARLLLDRETADLFVLAGRGAVVSPSEPAPLFSIDFKLPVERRKVRVDPNSVTEIIAENDENRGWLWNEQEPREVVTAPQSVEVA